MIRFEGYERRIAGIEACMAEYGIKDLEEARDICLAKGINVEDIVKGVQPIAFENAVWAYTLGCAVAIKKGVKNAADAAEAIGMKKVHIFGAVFVGNKGYNTSVFIACKGEPCLFRYFTEQTCFRRLVWLKFAAYANPFGMITVIFLFGAVDHQDFLSAKNIAKGGLFHGLMLPVSIR